MTWDYAYTVRPLAIHEPSIDSPRKPSNRAYLTWHARSTRRRTKERQSAFVSISGSARRGLLLRAAITSVVTVLVLLLAWRLLGGHNVRWQGINPSVGSVAARRARRRLLPDRAGLAIRRAAAEASGQRARAARRHRRVVGRGTCCSPDPRPTSPSSPWRGPDSRSASPADPGARSSPGSSTSSASRWSPWSRRSSPSTVEPPAVILAAAAAFVVGSRRPALADHPRTADAGDPARGADPEAGRAGGAGRRPSSTSSTAAAAGPTWSAARSSAGSPPPCSTRR